MQACQQAAIRHVYEASKHTPPNAGRAANGSVPGDSYHEHEHKRIAELIQDKAPIDVNFHPDRLVNKHGTVIDGLSASMMYENQFVSGISNGLLSASAESNRKRWESRLFGNAYDGCSDVYRPKYGALNLFDSFDGACPRFGSCYLRLKHKVHERCTLSYGDSCVEPENIGTFTSLNQILNALYDDFYDQCELKKNKTSLKSVSQILKSTHVGKNDIKICRILDDIVEVHVHGSLRLDRDVEFMSVDSSFSNTQIGKKLVTLAQRAQFSIRWRPRLRLRICEVPSAFRSANLLEFMTHCWKDGYVDAHQLGQLASELKKNSQLRNALAVHGKVDQLLKQTWHSIAAYGEPCS